MTINDQHCQVLIIGAGPSGLMMAAQLLRYGVQPVIIDSRLGPTDHSKALAVQARSLEIYRQMGIVDKVLNGGIKGKGIAFYRDGEPGAQLLYGNVNNLDTLYPFILMYPQSANERTLLEYLTLNCCPVYWNTTLTSVSQTSNIATVKLQSDGRSQTLTTDWLIGADGSHSTVRKSLNIPFEGDTYKSLFYLIDGKIADKDAGELIQVHLSDKGLAGFFPMPEQGYYRIIGNMPDSFSDDSNELQLADVLPSLNSIVGKEVIIDDCRWLITYKLHHRMAGQFRQGCTFLIGDAAHIHSPVGGQGMNTGLQDAYNLAWKLAYVIQNKASERILDSYAAERMPVARQLLKTTDRAFKAAMSTNWAAGFFKKHLMTRLLNFAWKREKVREFFIRTVSQTGINYRDSKLNLHLSQAKKIQAGDRLPCLIIHDEKRNQQTDLHQWCAKPGFTLIVMGKVIEEELFKIAKWLTQNHNGYINFYYLPPSAKNQPVFDAFEIGKNRHRSILIRPDMHIGFLNDAIDLDRMDAYMRDVVGMS
ncbi:FAD-dependent monooxygenase [Mucilaginibacter myungsuensis]|uniref:FAD-dependent monooxygenase n=1 Tax=Mucilaginibacter myungsuensis TaxID=649104 RepID=A0A929PVF9_9SPHI|nr:FAD-dependent monooxygenase [Mucilaginibacter myungsuensis]MBE9661743.1 FAD-dependent monooxygenase [Mucilaginibacter myungsuensis]MDN3599825.1 FAD-dependent monooxygenase [Mucilaginibacter myungsuensis]